MEGIVKALLENAENISVISVVLIGSVAFTWAVGTGKLLTAGQVAALKTSCDEQAAALKVAHSELRETEKLLIRLQAEKEMGWRVRATVVQQKVKGR